MTIKRRLQISNILMLVLPATIMVLINATLIFIITKVLGIQDFEELGEKAAYVGMGPAIIVAVAIFFTNRLLTRFVFVKITTPLDALSYGVRQIRDGNLSYRMEYDGKDEFSAICADFNDMAERLSDLVAERQRDETSRKELIAGISHDLRTPLTSIKAYVEGLEKGVAATPQAQRKYLDTIKIKTAELERIINQLFLFSKLDIGAFPFVSETVNLVQALETLVGQISGEYAEKGLSVSLVAETEALRVSMDIQQFRNAIMNIAHNSLKYKVKRRGRLDISCRRCGDAAVVELTDDGGGVPEESLPKLFTIFYRGDMARGADEGSGLGLAIAAKIFERMGGGIRAENAADGGLKVILTLPIAKEGAP